MRRWVWVGVAAAVGVVFGRWTAGEEGALFEARAEPRGAGDVVIAFRDRVVTTSDLSAFWFARYRDNWLRTVDALVDEEIVAAEARRLGVRVPPAVVRRGVEAELEARRRQLRETYGEEVDLAVEVRRGYGVDLPAYRDEILRPRVEMNQLLQRIVRLDTRRRPRIEVRVIVSDTEPEARGVLRKLGQGADFSLTAMHESKDATGRNGGVLPLIARGDLVFPEVEARLFAAEPGSLVGPLRVEMDAGTRWQVYKVVRSIEPWTGTRAALLERLEADLQEHPLERPEFDRWRERMRRDAGVRLLDPDGRVVVDRR